MKLLTIVIAMMAVITAGATTYIAWGYYNRLQDERLLNELSACITSSGTRTYSATENQEINRGREMLRTVIAENRAIGIPTAAMAATMKEALRHHGISCP